MNTENYEIKDIDLQKLVPFKLHSSQTYGGERLGQLMASIEISGLISPIIVRPIAEGESVKYEIICGHNRTKAMKELGRVTISAIVREDLSDHEAIELFYDSNLNQQSFADWNYSQKIEAVKYYDKRIKDTSRQGKRNDLENGIESINSTTSVYTRQKSGKGSKQSTARDKMARRLGISTATFSKYRSIIKLPDELVKSIARLLDQKMITFEAAYRISGLNYSDIKDIINHIETYPDQKIDMGKLNALRAKSKKMEVGVLSNVETDKIFIRSNNDDVIMVTVHRRNKN